MPKMSVPKLEILFLILILLTMVIQLNSQLVIPRLLTVHPNMEEYIEGLNIKSDQYIHLLENENIEDNLALRKAICRQLRETPIYEPIDDSTEFQISDYKGFTFNFRRVTQSSRRNRNREYPLHVIYYPTRVLTFPVIERGLLCFEDEKHRWYLAFGPHWNGDHSVVIEERKRYGTFRLFGLLQKVGPTTNASESDLDRRYLLDKHTAESLPANSAGMSTETIFASLNEYQRFNLCSYVHSSYRRSVIDAKPPARINLVKKEERVSQFQKIDVYVQNSRINPMKMVAMPCAVNNVSEKTKWMITSHPVHNFAFYIVESIMFDPNWEFVGAPYYLTGLVMPAPLYTHLRIKKTKMQTEEKNYNDELIHVS